MGFHSSSSREECVCVFWGKDSATGRVDGWLDDCVCVCRNPTAMDHFYVHLLGEYQPYGLSTVDSKGLFWDLCLGWWWWW